MSLLIAVIWLIPFVYTNLTIKKIKFLPSFLTYLYSTSNLFTKANYIWPIPYIQVWDQNIKEWITLPEEEYFPMQTFGYRSRLFEALYLALPENDQNRKIFNGIRREMAQWIAGRYATLNAHQPKPQTVRFIAGLYQAQENKAPEGFWQKPPASNFLDKDDVYIIGTFKFDKE